jgi:hypothetical protein
MVAARVAARDSRAGRAQRDAHRVLDARTHRKAEVTAAAPVQADPAAQVAELTAVALEGTAARAEAVRQVNSTEAPHVRR